MPTPTAAAAAPSPFVLRRIEFQVTGPTMTALTATFDDTGTTAFVLNPANGDLTPA